MDLGLRDRVCVVTGSTGGIGLATARLLADEGARVVVCGRDASAPSVPGRRAAVAVADLSRAGRARSASSRPRRPSAESTCLVNNVGYAYQLGFDELSDEHWDESGS